MERLESKPLEKVPKKRFRQFHLINKMEASKETNRRYLERELSLLVEKTVRLEKELEIVINGDEE